MSKYIDRDMTEQALIKEAAFILRKMPYITITDFVDRMIKIVQGIPAADVTPVRRGRWIEEDGIQICSECGEEHEWEDYRAPYCDTCGAKMNKEDRINKRRGILHNDLG